MTPDQIEEGFSKVFPPNEDRFDSPIQAMIAFKAGVEFAKQCHSLTEEEAGKITGEYSFLCGNPSRYVLDEKTVITLLMQHSNPSPVLEEVKKRILELRDEGMKINDWDVGMVAVAHQILDIITELSKGHEA